MQYEHDAAMLEKLAEGAVQCTTVLEIYRTLCSSRHIYESCCLPSI
jgi:hypothetical protein